jgi:ElaB/YqjD/DUF883 family membrane-anchored ribosome-binding protein
MERNDSGIDRGVGGGADNPADANEFSGSASAPSSANPTSDTPGGFDFKGTNPETSQSQTFRDRARNVIGTAGGRLADVGSTIREKTGTAKDKLADVLESGAERLRERSQSGATLAGATPEGAGTTTITSDTKVAQVSDRVAGGMEATAEWLRDADLDSLKSGIERQVKEHPGRTLLIAAGLGYLIGRAFRNNS